jgi:hypothetical protein
MQHCIQSFILKGKACVCVAALPGACVQALAGEKRAKMLGESYSLGRGSYTTRALESKAEKTF